jgi:hypothetical protein
LTLPFLPISEETKQKKTRKEKKKKKKKGSAFRHKDKKERMLTFEMIRDPSQLKFFKSSKKNFGFLFG